jgi:hypothetical protein
MSPESLVQLGGMGVMWLVYLFTINGRVVNGRVVNGRVVNERVVNESPQLPLVLAAVVLLQGAVAVGQFVRQADLGLAGLGEPTLNLAEYSINVLQARGHAWIRAYGLTPSPNVLGACLAILLVLLLPVMLSEIAARTTLDPPHVWRLTLTLATTAGVLGLLASFSRAAWAGFAAGTAVCVWMAWLKGGKGRRSEVTQRARTVSAWWLAPLVGGLIFAAMYGDLALSRLVHLDTPTEARSLSERERDVSLAWEIIQAHPWRGIGTGNYESAARAINPDAAEVHNIPLMVTAEWGLPGAALWLLLAVIGLRRPSDARAAWLALLVISLFDLSLWPTTSWHGAILFGLLAAQIATGQSRPATTAVSTDFRPSSGGGRQRVIEPRKNLGAVSSIGAGMLWVLLDAERREELRARGLARSTFFSWSKAAAQTRALYAQVLANC